ncbi:hypothetical protein [Escherichia coli]
MLKVQKTKNGIPYVAGIGAGNTADTARAEGHK